MGWLLSDSVHCKVTCQSKDDQKMAVPIKMDGQKWNAPTASTDIMFLLQSFFASKVELPIVMDNQKMDMPFEINGQSWACPSCTSYVCSCDVPIFLRQSHSQQCGSANRNGPTKIDMPIKITFHPLNPVFAVAK